MLVGQYSSKISLSGRIAFPKKFREKLGDKVIVTRGWEGCLMAVSQKEWSVLLEGTEDKSFVLGSKRDTARFLLGNAIFVDLDFQGRCTLPRYLRDYSQIKEEVVFLGLNRYVEIWSKTKWEKYQEYLTRNIGSISEKLVKQE